MKIILFINKDKDIKISKNDFLGFEKITKIFSKKKNHLFDKARYPLEISLFLTNDKHIKKLNKKYRMIDKPTDVLSFSFFTKKELKRINENISPDKKIQIGDIVISADRAKIQAKQEKINLKEELKRLFIHGLLHLFGYDHVTKKDRDFMAKLEKDIINKDNLSK